MPYIDSIVIGDNSSGKTLLLKLFIEKIKNDGSVYFIDAVNRGFDVKKISKTNKKPAYKKTILDTRLQEVNFNLVDSFNCFGTLTERVEIIYQLYEKEVQDLFYELTNDRFKIHYDDPTGEVDFGNGKGLLSSGYQAIIRILLELLYYQDMEIETNALQYAWVIIDELDEYLSPRYSAEILKFLKKTFQWGRWIVTTHSCDLVAATNDSNLIILDKGSYEVVDINDYTSISEVQIMLHFIEAHIKRFRLNDPKFRSRQLFDFIKNVIDNNGILPNYQYNNLTVKLFCEKLADKSSKEILEICKKIYVITFTKM